MTIYLFGYRIVLFQVSKVAKLNVQIDMAQKQNQLDDLDIQGLRARTQQLRAELNS